MSSSIRIEYCVVWNYHPRAAGLADDIEKRFGIRPSLLKGQGGVFEVTLEDEVIFSKQKEGRFPLPGEVEEAIEQRLGAEAKQGPFTTG